MDYFVLTVASLILFAATFFSTVTGFGFALIAAPVLTMVMGPKETVVFVIIAGVIVRVIMMWRTWGEFESFHRQIPTQLFQDFLNILGCGSFAAKAQHLFQCFCFCHQTINILVHQSLDLADMD